MLKIAIGMLLIILVLIILKVIWVFWMCYGCSSFKNEKTDILKRRKYLIRQTMVEPQVLIDKMPNIIGDQFQREWAIYTYSMFSTALTNIAHLYPETREESLKIVDSLIEKTMSPEIRKYDMHRWGEDPLESLKGDNSHLSYISILAWMISHYKFLGGTDKYDNLFQTLCETMNRRLYQHESLCLETYPGEPIYIPDMLVAIAALSNYSKLYKGKYSETVETWIKKAKSQFIDENSGLLCSTIDINNNFLEKQSEIRGSFSALSCYYLTFIDKEFAKEQYEKLKELFLQTLLIKGIKEYQTENQIYKFDIDAGPILFNFSPSGTAFAIGSATYHKDFKLRKKLLYTAEVAGSSVSFHGEKHYLLANFALVGEAIVLAMKSATEWEAPVHFN